MVIVLFETMLREDADLDDYETRSERMNELVRQMPGCVSVKRYTAADGDEVVIARFASEEALDTWRLQPEHVETQRQGREEFYESCSVAVCTTIREYEFHRQVDASEMEACAAVVDDPHAIGRLASG
ncbi:MAG TPA: antibiotic biosynthesis monooxygenase [Ktedonobacterales bacterium]|jgi:heme-degrading monooxygenase HmoA